MTALERDWPLTLRRLQADYPGMDISTEHYGLGRVWVARGKDGHPWVVLSSDLDRFLRGLDVAG